MDTPEEEVEGPEEAGGEEQAPKPKKPRRRLERHEKELLSKFAAVTVGPQQAEKIQELRRAFGLLAKKVVLAAKNGPDRTVALRKLHEAQMTVVHSMAREPVDIPEDTR